MIKDNFQSIILYPNPATETLNLLIPAYDDATLVQIMDINGRTIRLKNQQLSKKEISYHLTDLPQGLYYVRISQNSTVSLHSFIKI